MLEPNNSSIRPATGGLRAEPIRDPRINSVDPVLGQPIEQEIKVDEEQFQRRVDSLSLGNAANSAAVNAATRRGEELGQLQVQGLQIRSAISDVQEINRQIREGEPEVEPARIEAPDVGQAASQTLQALRDELETVVSQESVVFEQTTGGQGTFFNEGVPEIPVDASLPQPDDFLQQEDEQVEAFVRNVEGEIIVNREALLNPGVPTQAPVQDVNAPAELPQTLAQAQQEELPAVRPLTEPQEAEALLIQSRASIEVYADEAVQAQANIEQGVAAELYTA